MSGFNWLIEQLQDAETITPALLRSLASTSKQRPYSQGKTAMLLATIADGLESTNEDTARRVAELEAEAERLRNVARDAFREREVAESTAQDRLKRITDLQSKLAWTPIAQGLPTEPGRYQFIDDINFEHPDHGEFPHYWRKPKESPSDEYHWFLHGGRWFNSPLDWCRGYTYWRKVEVPTRPITLPEAT